MKKNYRNDRDNEMELKRGKDICFTEARKKRLNKIFNK